MSGRAAAGAAHGLEPGDRRVVVAMSGGVDSSVAAALLHEAGVEVVGITLRLHGGGGAAGARACCAGADIDDARGVARALGVPHYVLDYESRFRREVMEDFADSYVRGETPVPCVRCNQTVKFRDLLGAARDLGADALATGHYALRAAGADGPELHRAADRRRDQSYFLFATTRGQIARLRFPLGAMTKDEVRAHGERLGLPVAGKPDSQDICFVPDGDYASVVRRIRPGAIDPGDVVHVDGTVLGRHDGVIGFTVGQRRGLGLGGGGGPLYVVRVDAGARRVVVGPRSALGSAAFTVTGVNWLGDGGGGPRRVGVRVRSTRDPAPATLERDPAAGTARVALDRPERAVAPGQACVFYDRGRVLGGGWIGRAGAAAA